MSPLLRSATHVAVAATLALAGAAAQALTFAEAFEAARVHDAAYRAAGYEKDAAYFNVPIARASLLPSLSLNAAETSVQGTRQFANGLNQEVRTRLDYQAPQASLQMRMPLFNYEALTNYKQAQVQTEVADEIYRGQGMELMDRLAASYLQVLLSTEALNLAQAQVDAVQTQLGQATQREQRGEGTRVQVVQLQAQLDVARARLLEFTDQRDLAYRQLARLTGLPSAVLKPLPAAATSADTPAAQTLFPDKLGDWLDIAARQSPALKAREKNLDVARLAVKRQFAGHMPRLDVVGSASRNQNDSSSNVGQSTSLRQIGLQLSVPLFSGGGVDASVKQAQSRQTQAEEELRNERQALEVDVLRHFQAINNGNQKIAAYQKAVASTALALTGARRSQEMGLGTVSDVAELQTQHYSARRDLAQSRIDQLLSRVRLFVRAGMPMAEVAADLDVSLSALAAAPTAKEKKP
jgi:protease secretion system outer membrane protein